MCFALYRNFCFPAPQLLFYPLKVSTAHLCCIFIFEGDAPAPAATPCFGGKSVAFEAGGQRYVAGWDQTVTKAGAETKCKSVGGVLADLNTAEKLAAVG